MSLHAERKRLPSLLHWLWAEQEKIERIFLIFAVRLTLGTLVRWTYAPPGASIVAVPEWFGVGAT